MKSKEPETYNRSAKCSTKFINPKKKEKLSFMLDEYSRLCNLFIEFLWDEYNKGEKVKSRFLKADFPVIDTVLSARLVNSCVNQASSVVRSRIEQINKFFTKKVQKPETLEKLQQCPILKVKEMRIDSKNSTICLDTSISFDLVLELISLGKWSDKIILPMKKHIQFNNLVKRGGKLLNGIVIRENYIQFNFEFERIIKESGKTIGIDIGINNLYSTSDGIQSDADHQLKIYKELLEKIANQEYESKSHAKALKERDNHIQYMIKQLDFSEYNQMNTEQLNFVGNKCKSDSLSKFWNYSFILDKLNKYSEDKNVSNQGVASYYTSCRCNECGYVNSNNRKGKKFVCLHCGHSKNADISAAINISLNLFKLPRQVNQLKDFFWFPDRWSEAPAMCR